MTEVITYQVRELVEYIDWSYFFHAWGIKKLHTSDGSPETGQLMEEARRLLDELDGQLQARCLYRLCRANADGDNLLLDGMQLPLLRQQTPHADGSPYLCLSDFVRPAASGIADSVGVFAASVPDDMEKASQDDPYRHLLVQTLCDRLVEAAVERMHGERLAGIRPAVGYPSLPDQSVNFLLDELLEMKQIGITLTENGAMHPHASVCGLMLTHPEAGYFTVGKIGDDQLADYARRREMPVERMRQFLAANL